MSVMPLPPNESKKCKLLFWNVCQIDIQRTGIDWAVVARNLGIKRADSAQREWRDHFRDKMASDVALRRLKVGAKHTHQKVPAMPKRESMVPLEDDESQDEEEEGEAPGFGLLQSKMSRDGKEVTFETNEEEEDLASHWSTHQDDEDKNTVRTNEDNVEGEEMIDQGEMGAEEIQQYRDEHDYFANADDYEVYDFDKDPEI